MAITHASLPLTGEASLRFRDPEPKSLDSDPGVRALMEQKVGLELIWTLSMTGRVLLSIEMAVRLRATAGVGVVLAGRLEFVAPSGLAPLT